MRCRGAEILLIVLDHQPHPSGIGAGYLILELGTITLLMAFGFTVMLLKSLYIPCMILGCVWVFHILYFVFGVHTIQEKKYIRCLV